MMPIPDDDDDRTVRMTRIPPRAPRRWLPLVVALGCLVGVGVGGFVGWLALAPPPAVVHGGSPIPPVATTVAMPSFPVAVGDEAAILAARSPGLQVFRFAAAPHILVLSFPSLEEQGMTLNRLGAFVEKKDLPRNRLLSDNELNAAIRNAGQTPDTYYYGHDYRAADMARFFADAERDGIALNTQELKLRALLTQEGMLAQGAVGALISIPPESADVDAASRVTILHHELSHGLYFTDPVYAAHAHDFWNNVLTDDQRAGFRNFLSKEGYEKTDEDLMLNETQAYLIHTPDPRFFRPKLAGLTDAEAARLRGIFLQGMQPGWLKDAVTPPASPVVPSAYSGAWQKP